jgi:serine/threonine-protein kinase
MLEVGQIIDGKYRVEGLLGQGGMGAVYAGLHLHIDSRVAIKVLLPEVTQSPEGNARFEREVRATGRIGNEHILRVYDVGTLPDGSRYMVSELLEGETMASRLKHGALTARTAAELTVQLLDGLAAAHAAGIVHRDLKPDNIFLLPQKRGQADFVKIIDFGVSKFQTEDPQSMSMTTTGAVIGTPYYLSPEQARGQKDIDARSDLYTVGVIMYQAVAGQVPVRADSFNELLFKIALQPPPPLTQDVPGVDPAFSALTAKAMAKEREARFQDANEMREALEAWLGGVVRMQSGRTPAPGAWTGNETVAAPSGVPTSSNFGRTSPPLGLYGEPPERRSMLPVFAAVGAVLVAGAVLAVFKLAGSHPTPAPSSVAVPIAPAGTTAAAAPAPTATETDRPIELAPTPAPTSEAPRVEAVEQEPSATATAPIVRAPRNTRSVSRGTQASGSKAASPAPEPVPSPAAPSTASESTRKRKHDFGY